MTFPRRLLLGFLAAILSAPLAAQSAEDVKPQVAELVRSALQDPESEETWRGLAQLLPELALTDTADVVSVFEASRLADSLANAPLLPTQVIAEAAQAAESANASTTTSETGTTLAAGASTFAPTLTSGITTIVGRAGASLQGMARRLDAGTLLMIAPWAAVGLLLLAGLVVRKRRGTTRTGTTSDTETVATDAKAQRRWTVTTLAESGLPPAEIARRTGMAQDAVHVLLGLRSSPNAPRSRAGGVGDMMGLPTFIQPGAATRPPSLGEQAAGIATAKAQLTREARRMKGGRLTYGPGRLA